MNLGLWTELSRKAGGVRGGAKHILVEQDRCDVPPLEAIKNSYDYLRYLRLS